MPEPVSNNAVCAGYSNGKRYVYSFGGIDTSKTYSGIHSKCWRYDIENNHWETLEKLPGNVPRIASSATYLDGVIYVIGGYEVFANGSETSIDLVHRFDCESNTFISNASPLARAIDDHVFGIWRDSVLLFITGWSNTGNLALVQLYDPQNDSWTTQSQIWNFSKYSSFGASGIIIEDTIYYLGGAASSFGFPSQPFYRKGIIDKNDPLNISWSEIEIDSGYALYRSAALSMDGIPTWVGGSLDTYNYDGLAYDGAGGVSPSKLFIQIDKDEIHANNCAKINMDLRGIAWFPEHGELYSTGGMGANQKVSNQLVRFSIATLSNHNVRKENDDFQIFPNPTYGKSTIRSSIPFNLTIYTIHGESIHSEKSILSTDIELKPGVYLVHIETNEFQSARKLIVSK